MRERDRNSNLPGARQPGSWFLRWRGAGQAAIEFSLVLPMLLLLLFGIINFGLLMYDLSVATNAAREGARWQSVSSNYSKTGNSKGYTIGETACGATKVDNPTRPEQVVCNYFVDVPLINIGSGDPPMVIVSGSSSIVTVSVHLHYGWIGYTPFSDLLEKTVSATMYYEP